MRLAKVFDCVEVYKSDASVLVDGVPHKAKKGKHSIWVPDLQMKFPFQWNGHFVEYLDWRKGQHAEKIETRTFGSEQSYSFDSLHNIVEEYLILDLLSRHNFSPNVGDFFYIKNLKSDFLDNGIHCDPKGAYGFFMDDANKYEPKKFDKGKFKKAFIRSKIVHCSDSALSDICFENRDNHVNGYIVDIRRSVHDAICLVDNGQKETMINKIMANVLYEEEVSNLKRKILELTQFPKHRRESQYQCYWLGNEYVKGSRDMLYRFDKLGVPKTMKGLSVLDLGCNLGTACQESYRRGSRVVVGLDYEFDYIDCARDLARYNGHQINFLQMDLVKVEPVINFVNRYFGKEPIDIIYALAVYKHVGTLLWDILDGIKFKTIYLESSSCQDENTKHVRQVTNHLQKKYKTEFLGFTEDRNKRAIWRAETV